MSDPNDPYNRANPYSPYPGNIHHPFQGAAMPPHGEYAPAQYPAAPPPVAFREGQTEWNKADSMRWGDESAIQIVVPPLLVVASKGTSSQLVNAHLPRPLVWLVQFAASAMVPAGEVAPITIAFTAVIGCGQSNSRIVVASLVLTAANNYQVPVGTLAPNAFLPASDLQVQGAASYTPTIAGTTVVNVGAMAAPFTRWD